MTYSARQYDPSKFTYLPTANLPNVVISRAASDTYAMDQLAVPQMFSELTTRLLKKRPRWTYVYDYHEYQSSPLNDTKLVPRRLSVYDLTASKVSIGTVLLDRHWSTGGMRYALDSRKLDSKRQRNSYTYTTDVAKAAKLCLTSFAAKSSLEVWNENKMSISGSMGRVSWVRQQEVQRVENKLAAPVMQHLREHPEMFLHVKNIDRAVLESLPALLAEHAASSVLTVSYTSSSGTMISIVDGVYFVEHNGAGVVVQELEDLSTYVRTRLGMLKLVEPGTFVVGVGYRGESPGTQDTFYILPE